MVGRSCKAELTLPPQLASANAGHFFVHCLLGIPGNYFILDFSKKKSIIVPIIESHAMKYECLYCGRPFTKEGKYTCDCARHVYNPKAAAKSYDSQNYNKTHGARRGYGTRLCDYCGSEFKPPRSNAYCCSPQCVTLKNNPTLTFHECKWCGSEFLAPRITRIYFCSPQCQILKQYNGKF
jgi:hypothetical protein